MESPREIGSIYCETTVCLTVCWPGTAPDMWTLCKGMSTEPKEFTSLLVPVLQLCGLPTEDEAESVLTRLDA